MMGDHSDFASLHGTKRGGWVWEPTEPWDVKAKYYDFTSMRRCHPKLLSIAMGLLKVDIPSISSFVIVMFSSSR